ncbi:hypothetical protein KCU73_g13114, partial [Aureobasidium melanogenum]
STTMSNDLQSILARHNLRGINVANFSGSSQQRPPPQQNHTYQYPAPVPQQRVQYPWGAAGQGSVPSTVRPSFAWPSPPQPQYTIDPRHYSYNIWGKAPVYSMTGEEEEEGEEEEGDDVEGEEGQADGEAVSDAQAAAEPSENIETEKPAEDAATETAPEATASDTGEKDISPEDPNPDAAAAAEPVVEESSPDVPATQQPSDPPQEEAASAIPTASEPPVEAEIAAESTETAPQEGESDIAPEPRPEEEAHASDPAPSDIIDGVEPNHQDSGNILEDANASQGESAVSDVPAPVEIVEDEKQKNENSESSPEEAQEDQADGSQSPGAEAQNLEQNVIDVAEVPRPSSDEPHPVDSSGGDISQEGLPSHDISTVEQHPIAEYDAASPEAQSSEPITCPKETDETVIVEGPTASENIQDTSPEDCNEIVQVIDVNNNDSTDDTAAIIVVDVDTPNTLENTISPPPPPPPPSAPHVTISP